MFENYLSEIRIFSFGFTPKGWAQCNGQTLPIKGNENLFSLLKTTYGGDGTTNFKLPNLMGAAAMHRGQGYDRGVAGGEARHTLAMAEMPAHTHQAYASGKAPDKGTVLNTFWPSNTGAGRYGEKLDTPMAAGALANVGNNQGHENMQPYLGLNICIAVVGIYPQHS